MRMTIIAAFIAASLAAPVSAGTVDDVADKLTKADEAAAAYLKNSKAGNIFESFFGLMYLGKFYEKQCGKIGGEWVHDDDANYSCEKNLIAGSDK